MPKTLTATSTYTTTIPYPVDGTDLRTAASIEPSVQAALNRIEYVRRNGTLTLRSAADLTALAALAGMADEETAFVAGVGLYRYDAASTLPATGDTAIAATGGGVWLLETVSLDAILSLLVAELDALGDELDQVRLEFGFDGEPVAGARRAYLATRGLVVEATAPGAQAAVLTLPTAATTFTLHHRPAGSSTATAVGSVAFATSGLATLSFPAAVTLAAGDVLYVEAPDPADATAADVLVVLPAFALL